MADDKFSAGLTDQDELSQFPSAANPLTAYGIDPDMARANPELLAALNPNAAVHGGESAKPPISGPVSMPTGELAQAPAPAAAQPASAPPSTATDYGMAGLASLNQNAKMATDAAGAVPTSSPDVERLSAQRARFAAPAPLRGPDGKMLNQTTEIDPATGQPITINPKPTTGTRIWRGVRGGLQGLLTGGIRGGLLGAINPELEGGEAYGAPNKAYQAAEQQREGKLASTDADLGNAFKNWKDQVDAAKAKASEYRANAALGKDITTGSTEMQNAATKALEEKDTAAKNAADSPAAKDAATVKMTKAQLDQRQSIVDTDPAFKKMSPLNKMLYVLNGKVPDPREPNEAEVNAAQAARALVVFKAQHGGQGPQTLEDFNSIQAAARGSLGRGAGKGDPNADEEVSSIVADATQRKQEFADRYERNKDGSYNIAGTYNADPKTRLTPQEYQHRIDAFRTAANVKLAKKGTQIDDQGNVVSKGGASNSEGDVVTVIDGNGNQGTLPRKNLAAAQARDKKLKVVGQ